MNSQFCTQLEDFFLLSLNAFFNKRRELEILIWNSAGKKEKSKEERKVCLNRTFIHTAEVHILKK